MNTRTISFIFGVTFIAVDLLGFISNPLVGMDGLFEVNYVHNVVHILLGLAFIFGCIIFAENENKVLIFFGIGGLLVTMIGFLTSGNMMLGIIHANQADHWLHLGLGLVILGSGFIFKNKHTSVIEHNTQIMSDTFSAIIEEVRACTLCASHLPFPPKPIIQLHPDAKILIAGQAPGLKVQKSGIPFDDASGKRLREWMGVNTDFFYNPQCVAILPMGFCYPGTGKSGDYPPRPECAAHWRQRLLKFLPNLKLTLVIGQYAQKAHLTQRKSNLTETVQSWQDYWPTVLPLPHPSPRNNIWLKKNPWFETKVVPALKERVRYIYNYHTP